MTENKTLMTRQICDNDLELGRLLATIVEGEDCYDFVDWDLIIGKYYLNLAEQFKKDEISDRVLEYLNAGNLSYPNSDLGESFDRLKSLVKEFLLIDYYYDDDKYAYMPCKKIQDILELLKNNSIPHLIKISDNQEIVEVNTNFNGSYIEVYIDEPFEYSLVTGLNRNKSIDDCSLTKYDIEDEEELLESIQDEIGKYSISSLIGDNEGMIIYK